jgi:hypothetical protein
MYSSGSANASLLDRLMLQVEHVLVANQTTIVTKEVVETARQNLIIGPEFVDEMSRNRSFDETSLFEQHS